MIWRPQRRAAWIWAALLPLLWMLPAGLALANIGAFGRGGDPDLVTAGAYGGIFLPLLAGSPWGWTVRPIGVLGWLWLAANIGLGLLAVAMVGLIGFGT